MGRKLILNVPQKVYEALSKSANKSKQTPEELAVRWLETVVQQIEDDPLEKFIGAFKSNITDWADQHDKYIGKDLMKEVRSEDHERAMTCLNYLQTHRDGITTNYIILELVTLLASALRTTRSKIIAFIESLKSSPHVEIVHVDATLDMQSWQLLKTRIDKEWSLVDCASFIIMQQRGIKEALTTDHHLEQAGFIRLLINNSQ